MLINASISLGFDEYKGNENLREEISVEIKSVYISQSVADKIFRKHDVVPKEVREVFSNAYFKPKIYHSECIPGAYVAFCVPCARQRFYY